MEYMTKKEYEEKKAALEKEIDKHYKRGLYGWVAAGVSIIATVALANTLPLKVAGGSLGIGFAFYTLLGPGWKREDASIKLQELKEQRLSELEQRVKEE